MLSFVCSMNYNITYKLIDIVKVHANYIYFSTRYGMEIAREVLSIEDNEGRTPLDWAAQAGNVNVMEYLIRRGGAMEEAQVDEENMPLPRVSRELPTAVSSNKNYINSSGSNRSRSLLNPLRVDRMNRSALYWAVKYHRLDAVKYLLKCGCDPYLQPRGMITTTIATNNADMNQYDMSSDNYCCKDESKAKSCGYSPMGMALLSGDRDLITALEGRDRNRGNINTFYKSSFETSTTTARSDATLLLYHTAPASGARDCLLCTTDNNNNKQKKKITKLSYAIGGFRNASRWNMVVAFSTPMLVLWLLTMIIAFYAWFFVAGIAFYVFR